MKKDIGTITSLLFSFNQKLKEAFGKNTNETIPSMVQMRVLYFVSIRKNPSMKDVSEYFCISSPSATEMIERLIKAGFLTRKSNLDDRRSVNIAITPKGKKELNIAKSITEKFISKSVSSLSKKELGSFLEILRKINN
ncbi:MAG: MarR family transcriptional regulator [bacterium]